MERTAKTILVVVMVMAMFGPAAAQSKLTAGATALLVDGKKTEDHELLLRSLVDDAPDVRAVGARVAALAQPPNTVAILTKQLEVEQDVHAATEQTRTLLLIAQAKALPAATAAVRRLGRAVRLVVLEWLARNEQQQIISLFPELVRDVPESEMSDIGGVAAMAVQQAPPPHRSRLNQTFASALSGEGWRTYVTRLIGLQVWTGTLLREALVSMGADAEKRERTIWATLSHAVASTSGDVLLQDLDAALTASSQADDTAWATFGRHLVVRRVKKTSTPDATSVIEQHAGDHTLDTQALRSIQELSNEERAALKKVLGSDEDDSAARSRAVTATPRFNVTATTFPSLTPGFKASLFEALRCVPSSNERTWGAARVVYRNEGWPREIALHSAMLTPECAAALRILTLLTVMPSDQPVMEGQQYWLILPLAKTEVYCSDQREPEQTARIGAPARKNKVTAPKKVRNVAPNYPEAAQTNRIQGVVVIESTISSEGCVRDARVIRSVVTALDLEALRAVSLWRFTPTLLEGRPVPVIMTVTVNFTLQ